jgi:hypothetical protein
MVRRHDEGHEVHCQPPNGATAKRGFEKDGEFMSERRSPGSAGLVLLVAFSGGCTDDAQQAAAEKARAERKERIAKLEVEVTARIELARRAFSMLTDVPKASAKQPPPRFEPPLKIRALDLRDKEANTDVMLVGEMGRFDRGILGACDFHLKRRDPDLEDYSFESILRGCTQIRRFLVVRPDVQLSPKLNEDEKTYEIGGIIGDVVAFELAKDGPQVVGSFAIEAALSRRVEVRRNDRRALKQLDLDEALRRELLRAIEKAASTN